MGPMLMGTSFALPAMAGPCLTNVYNALLNRHLTQPKHNCTIPIVNPFTIGSFPRLVEEAMDRHDTEAWRQGKTTVKLARIDESRKYDKPEHSKAQSHVKMEVNVLVPTKTRLIQGNVNELTAYEFPVEYTAMTSALKKVKDLTFNFAGVECTFVYAGGLNHDELSDHISLAIGRGKHVVFDERDGKNWDSTMNEALLREESAVYGACGLKCASVFLERCASTVGRIRVKMGMENLIVKYLTAWKRLSGDWNTSVGNTLISMMIVATVMTNLPAHLRPKRMTGYFMGDDYLGVMEYDGPPDYVSLRAALDDLESRCGITPERGLFVDPMRVSFISMGLWPRHEGGFQFIPHPGKQLAKLFWAKDRTWHAKMRAYTTGVAAGAWRTFYGFTLMTNFLKNHYHDTGTVGKGPWWLRDATREVRGVDWHQGFVFKYDVPYCATLFTVPSGGVYHHPLINLMLEVDLSDPQKRRGCLGVVAASGSKT